MEKSVFPIHFEDRSGKDFERICFAYLLRTKNWLEIDWYGQLGSDRGRDICGTVKEDTDRSAKLHVYQCVNFQKLTMKKAKEDLDKIINGPKGRPDKVTIICGGTVSAGQKDKIKEYAKIKGIADTEVWSAVEFEERLRKETPDLILRFSNGIEFPETKQELIDFVFDGITDESTIIQYGKCFIRPAFRAPFRQESSLPAFKKAITDTIEALSTGIYRLRDGTEIKRIKPYHELKSEENKKHMEEIIKLLENLRNTFDEMIRRGKIKPCGCGDPECPVFMISDESAENMDMIRRKILRKYAEVNQGFDITFAEYV